MPADASAESDRRRLKPLPIKLDYDDSVDGVARPYLRLTLVGPSGKRVPVLGVVDTGADFSILPIAFAEELGFTFHALRLVPGGHAGGDDWFRKAEEGVSARFRKLDVAFELEPRYANTNTPAWGRKDFLRWWNLTLSERRGRFKLTWAL